MTETIVYTDGSCLGNPGKGGWAAVIIKNNQEEIIFGSEKNSMQIKKMLKIKIFGQNWTALLIKSKFPGNGLRLIRLTNTIIKLIYLQGKPLVQTIS